MSIKKMARRPLVQVLYLQVDHHITILGMVMWWPTCNYDTCTRCHRASFLILPMMGTQRPEHVEWLCRNKTCTMLHQVGVLTWLANTSNHKTWGHRLHIFYKEPLPALCNGCIPRNFKSESPYIQYNFIILHTGRIIKVWLLYGPVMFPRNWH